MLHTGRKPFVPDSRDWQWSDLRVALKAAGVLPSFGSLPQVFGHGGTFHNWKMCGNGPDPTAPGKARDGAGNCVWASGDHETMESLATAGMPVLQVASLFNGFTAISDYAADTGYNPETGEHDEGTEIRAALNYRQTTGLVDVHGNRHKIGPYVSLEPGNVEHLLEALYFFEGLPIGVNLQRAQMEAFNAAEAAGATPVWDYVAGSENIGGHCIPLVGRPNTVDFAGLSWALRLFCTPLFLDKLCEEAWAYTTPERISKVTGKSYEGASLAQLEEYLHLVGKSALAA